MHKTPERHAVLGAGGVGGLIGGLLAAAGEDVTLIVRPAVLAGYPRSVTVRRAHDQIITGPVKAVASLDASDAPDVLWITTKATQLTEALRGVAGARPTAVVPLLNGVDHIATLDAIYGRATVIPATIAVEAERTAPGEIEQRSAFATLQFAARGRSSLERAASLFGSFGATTAFEPNETTLLWSKLAFLAPFALTTTAADADAGFIRTDAQWRQTFEDAAAETFAAGTAEGANLDARRALTMIAQVPPTMRSSMWRDVAAGNAPELDAIGGAVIRAAERHRLAAPVTRDLIARVARRAAAGR